MNVDSIVLLFAIGAHYSFMWTRLKFLEKQVKDLSNQLNELLKVQNGQEKIN